MIGESLMHRGAADFDHLEAVRGFQHPVTNFRRLQHAIARVQQEGIALILIDQAHPAGHAIDHLEADLVEMDVIGHRSALADADLGGDETPAEPARDQVAILHAGAAEAPGLLAAQAGQHEFLSALRQFDGPLGLDEFRPRTFRTDKLARHARWQRR